MATRKAKVSGPVEAEDFFPCFIPQLPEELWMPAARDAIEENPANAPRVDVPGLSIEQLAALTNKYWGTDGVSLGVAFLDNPPQELRTRIIQHMNAWNERGANVKFQAASLGMAQVRIARNENAYWSYLGRDILHVNRNQPTMMLGRFTTSTTEATFRRVVRHETGHTLSFPHEQLRRAIVELLDPAKVLEYFRRTQGWDEGTIRANVLTPIEENELLPASSPADQVSIMTYFIPAALTKTGADIPGGNDINDQDYATVARLFPGAVAPPPPPPSGGVTVPEAGTYRISTGADGKKVLTFTG